MKNFAFIGSGRIVNWFLEDLNNSKYKNEINLFGIWNRDFNSAKLVSDKFNIKTVFSNIDEMLTQKEIDLVYIGTPDEVHHEYVKKALLNNKNVFCEKPLSLTLDEAKELYTIANSRGLLLFEGIKTGFSPAFKEANRILNSGELGEMKYIYATHAKVSTKGTIPNPNSTDKIAGFHKAGGMYALFSALAIAGDVKSLSFLNSTYPNNDAIQTSILNIRHKNGSVSTVVGSDSFTDDLSTKIFFDKGYIKIGGRIDLYNEDYKKDSAHMPYTITIYDNQNRLINFKDYFFHTNGEGLFLEIDHVYELLINNKKESNIVTKEISLRIIEILEKTNKVNDNLIIDKWEKYDGKN